MWSSSEPVAFPLCPRHARQKRALRMYPRHTFCSHLAMRGAPAKAIQELAGYQDLRTTQMYMHLSPAALESAIRLLEGRAVSGCGDSLETALMPLEISV